MECVTAWQENWFQPELHPAAPGPHTADKLDRALSLEPPPQSKHAMVQIWAQFFAQRGVKTKKGPRAAPPMG